MNSNKARFESAHPRGFLIDALDRAALEEYARDRGFLHPGESLLSAARAGEGNMNLTLRLVTTGRSFILKQARPWVEKYPAIEAPAGRALVEGAFYRTVAPRSALRKAMPELLGQDPDSGVLVLEDLGEAKDFTDLYRGGSLSEADLDALVSYLIELHRPFAEREPLFENRLFENRLFENRLFENRLFENRLFENRLFENRLFENRKMRALNHEHIFRLPLAADNGLDLDRITPGLDALSRELSEDGRYVSRVRELGALYLEDGDSLVHGDYFPGSWLRTEGGIRVIDPEFCFLGNAAFDLGVLCAHLYLCRRPELAGRAVELYGADAGFASTSQAFAGVEVMRRLVGVAQLPLEAGLDEKRELLALSKRLV